MQSNTFESYLLKLQKGYIQMLTTSYLTSPQMITDTITNTSLTEASKKIVLDTVYKIGNETVMIQDSKIILSQPSQKSFIEALHSFLTTQGEAISFTAFAKTMSLVLGHTSRQFDNFKYKIDLFADTDRPSLFKLNGDKKDSYEIIKGGLPKVHGAFSDIQTQPFIKKYIEHSPYLPFLVESIIYNYINPQKNCFLSIQKPSSTGKSLEITALQNAGLTFEIEQGLMSIVPKDGNSSVQVNDLTTAISVTEDEFTRWDMRLKKITTGTTITPKFKNPVVIENVGMKLMFFADDELGVNQDDEQIATRLVHLDMLHSQPLKNKSWFKNTDFVTAKSLLTRYVAYIAKNTLRTINDKVSNPYDIEQKEELTTEEKEAELSKFYTHVADKYSISLAKCITAGHKERDELRAKKKAEAELNIVAEWNNNQRRLDKIMFALKSYRDLTSEYTERNNIAPNAFFPMDNADNRDIWFMTSPTKNLQAIVTMIEGKELGQDAKRYRKTMGDGLTHSNIIEKFTANKRFNYAQRQYTGLKFDFTAWEYSLVINSEDVPS